MAFLDEDYLLTNGTARKIYAAVEGLPILDAHNHADLEEIFRNDNYTDIWQVEAATDHYVWELMRKRGVPENLITGDATNREKWDALARVFPEFAGNPTYEWVHLDLRRRLSVEKLINGENAGAIWEETSRVLQLPENTPRKLLTEMGVETMCSTDDPTDPLEYHGKLGGIPGLPSIRPTWRPDRAMNIEKPDFPEYVKKLGARVGGDVETLQDLVGALEKTHEYFAKYGCRATDHGIQTPYGYDVPEARAADIFKRRLGGELPSAAEVRDFKSHMMHRFAEMNSKAGWVMQLHVGAVRDVRSWLFRELGPDCGGDVSDHTVEILNPLRDLLNQFDGSLKVVLYSLDPTHWPTLATITRAFGENVNLGAAWWFNDSPVGMKRQLEYLASVDLLMNFAGMVTDSRKLLSYGSRTEVFRRVLSDVLGGMVERGQVPLDVAIRVAEHVCYTGPKSFFGF
ncbi:MAG: glucuronate isomerase [Promethearchaeota archaeon]